MSNSRITYKRTQKETMKAINAKLEDEFRCPSVDVDAFAISTACCVDLWPLESDQVISRGQWIFSV